MVEEAENIEGFEEEKKPLIDDKFPPPDMKFILPKGMVDVFQLLFTKGIDPKTDPGTRDWANYTFIVKAFWHAKSQERERELLGTATPGDAKKFIRYEEEIALLNKYKKWKDFYLQVYDHYLPRDPEYIEFCKKVVQWKDEVGGVWEFDRLTREEFLAVKATVDEKYRLLESELWDVACAFLKDILLASIWPALLALEGKSPAELQRLVRGGGFGL